MKPFTGQHGVLMLKNQATTEKLKERNTLTKNFIPEPLEFFFQKSIFNQLTVMFQHRLTGVSHLSKALNLKKKLLSLILLHCSNTINATYSMPIMSVMVWTLRPQGFITLIDTRPNFYVFKLKIKKRKIRWS